jgi:hypothetical protein
MKTSLRLLIVPVLLLAAVICRAQSEIVTIDGVYVDRDTVDAKGNGHTARFRINKKPIIDGDVIVFDIPGFGDYLQSSGVSLSDVRLLVADIEIPEMPAFAENLESGVVRFEFSQEDLSAEHRQKIFNRSGGSLKELRLGIKAGDSSPINYSQKAQFYFGEIDTWQKVGLFLIVGLILAFGLLIVRFPTILKENVPSQFRGAFANFVKPDIDKLLQPAQLPQSRTATAGGTTPAVVPGDSVQPADESVPVKLHEYIELSKIKLAYSFNKSQLVFWTLIVISSFIYIWAMTDDFTPLNTSALVLLGISSATSVAGSIVGGRQATAALNSAGDPARLAAHAVRTDEPEGEHETLATRSLRAFLESRQTDNNYFRDILSDNHGISIHRVQAFAFNIVFGIIFLKSVVLDYAMPSFDETELMLLGLSNGTYTFLKSAETT